MGPWSRRIGRFQRKASIEAAACSAQVLRLRLADDKAEGRGEGEGQEIGHAGVVVAVARRIAGGIAAGLAAVIVAAGAGIGDDIEARRRRRRRSRRSCRAGFAMVRCVPTTAGSCLLRVESWGESEASSAATEGGGRHQAQDAVDVVLPVNPVADDDLEARIVGSGRVEVGGDGAVGLARGAGDGDIDAFAVGEGQRYSAHWRGIGDIDEVGDLSARAAQGIHAGARRGGDAVGADDGRIGDARGAIRAAGEAVAVTTFGAAVERADGGDGRAGTARASRVWPLLTAATMLAQSVAPDAGDIVVDLGGIAGAVDGELEGAGLGAGRHGSRKACCR